MGSRKTIVFAAAAAFLLLTIKVVAVPGLDRHDSLSTLASKPAETIQPVNYAFAEVAAEFLKPPVGCTGSNQSPQGNINPLPAIPAAFFMVIAGFLCVSLVKDRRVWLAVLTGMLHLGIAGINTVPQLQLLPHHPRINRKIKLLPLQD